MTGWNLPPGVTDEMIERAAGSFDEEPEPEGEPEPEPGAPRRYRVIFQMLATGAATVTAASVSEAIEAAAKIVREASARDNRWRMEIAADPEPTDPDVNLQWEEDSIGDDAPDVEELP